MLLHYLVHQAASRLEPLLYLHLDLRTLLTHIYLKSATLRNTITLPTDGLLTQRNCEGNGLVEMFSIR